MPVNPAPKRQREEDYCELEDSLGYLVSSRLALMTRIKSFSKEAKPDQNSK